MLVGLHLQHRLIPPSPREEIANSPEPPQPQKFYISEEGTTILIATHDSVHELKWYS